MSGNKKLFYYIEQSEIAINYLSNTLGYSISNIDFQKALGSRLGYVNYDSHRIMEHSLSAEQMLNQLSDYPFSQKIATIELEYSVLTDDVPRQLNEEKVKHSGEIWEIHKNDKDPFPSNPHAHNYSAGYKLHLGTGELFNNKNKPLKRSISKKDLLIIRGKITNITLPVLGI